MNMEKEVIEKYKEAGRIAKEVREFAKEFVKKGMTLLEIAEKIEGKIIESGAEIAFPVNLSINEIAAHKTPIPREETFAEGLLKIDIGVCVSGYIGDTAIALDLTDDKKYSQMIELNEKLLNVAKNKVNPNFEVRDIGEVISKELDESNLANETNYTIVHGLTGHGLDQDLIHTSPNIPNYANSNSKKLENSAFAVEPFLTTGAGEIYEGAPGGIYSVENPNGKIRDRDAREILEFIIKTYKTRPFCERWLEKQGFRKIRFTLNELTKLGIIHSYPLLIEKTKAPVSQMEHSFLISGEEVVCTTC